MKRNNTILTLCGMLVIADWLCFWETLNAWPNLTMPFAVSMLTGQILTALLLSWMAFVVVKSGLPSGKSKFSLKGFGIRQPVRRIFVSVWP